MTATVIEPHHWSASEVTWSKQVLLECLQLQRWLSSLSQELETFPVFFPKHNHHFQYTEPHLHQSKSNAFISCITITKGGRGRSEHSRESRGESQQQQQGFILMTRTKFYINKDLSLIRVNRWNKSRLNCHLMERVTFGLSPWPGSPGSSPACSPLLSLTMIKAKAWKITQLYYYKTELKTAQSLSLIYGSDSVGQR